MSRRKKNEPPDDVPRRKFVCFLLLMSMAFAWMVVCLIVALQTGDARTITVGAASVTFGALAVRIASARHPPK